MSPMTKNISLVLVSSALVFVGWGCPLGHEHDKEHHNQHPGGQPGHAGAGYHGGSSWWWYSRPTGYTGAPRPASGGTVHRGGFGSTGVHVGE